MKSKFFVIFLLICSFNVFAGDDVRYDEKKRLLCEVASLHPKFSDFFVGDFRKGWLRIKHDEFYSIAIAGWVVSMYSDNNSDYVVNNSKSLYVRDYAGMAKLNKKSGKVSMKMELSDNSNVNIQWICNIGANQPNNREY